MCPPALHITLGIFFRLFILLENAAHELDVRGVLQGANCGAAYDEYVKSFRRKVDLEDKSINTRAEISVLHQLVSIYTVLTRNSAATSPTTITIFTQLQGELQDKMKELDDMVICK